MNIGFERFRKRLRRGALIKSLLFGLSCGIVAAAVYMAVQKLRTFSPDLLLSLAIGGGTAALAALIAFLILNPSELKIAKKLDSDLDLGEKVQTMLAFRDKEGDILTLQREDTNQRLMNADARAVRYRHPWRHFIAPIAAAFIMTVAVMTPVKAVTLSPVPEEPDFEMNNVQETELMDLIEYVKNSEMEEIPKGATVAILEALLEDLRTAELKDSEMKQTVIGAIVAVNRVVSTANSNDEFYAAMNESDVTMLSELANAMSLLSGIQAKSTVDRGREALKVDDVAEPVTTMADSVERILAEVGDSVSQTDSVCVALSAFAKALRELESQLPSYTRNWAQEQLDGIFKTFATDMNRALARQHVNRETGNVVVTTLMDIFGLTEEDIPAEQKPQTKPNQGATGDQDDEELKDAQGGISDGELLLGSDELIFDHLTNQQVKYGEVLFDYYTTVSGKITNQTQSGTIDPELEQYISDYFKALFDGSEKETGKS